MTYSKLDGFCVLLEGFVELLGLEERLIRGQRLQSKEGDGPIAYITSSLCGLCIFRQRCDRWIGACVTGD